MNPTTHPTCTFGRQIFHQLPADAARGAPERGASGLDVGLRPSPLEGPVVRVDSAVGLTESYRAIAHDP